MRNILLTVLLSFGGLVLAGCTAQPALVYDEAFFSVKFVDHIPTPVEKDGKWVKTYGITECSNFDNNQPICSIELLKEDYPDCLYHELRHVFEGNWHEGYETTWDCDK